MIIVVHVNFTTTDYSKFGNGIIKRGEDESARTWVKRYYNENSGRSIYRLMECYLVI
jgi:hypothetical protein